MWFFINDLRNFKNLRTAWGGSDELPPETFGRKFPSIEGRQPKYMTSLAFHAVWTMSDMVKYKGSEI